MAGRTKPKSHRRGKQTKKRKMGSSQKFTAKKRAFLKAYSETLNITSAAREAGCSRQAHYKWLKTDKTYPKALQEAEEKFIQEAARRVYKKRQKATPKKREKRAFLPLKPEQDPIEDQTP